MTKQGLDKTIIVQGKIFPTTEQLIRNLRKVSDARIIVSTWVGEEISVDDIDNCITLFLQDPGAGPIQNFSRQLYGANQALGLVDRGLVAKIRSDVMCDKDIFSVYNQTPSSLSPLRHKIFISNVMSCVPEFRVFSPSDWIYLGEHEDIKEWFDIEEQSKSVFQYVDCCEQIFCVSNLLKQRKDIDLNQITQRNDKNKLLTSKFFEQNFVFVGTRNGFGAIIGRYPNHLDTDSRFIIPEIS
tara:strand:+ start:10280 stop:11002 length:723 start_codon:yes stop_codon:yes gene_type:complete